jgi:hypothetical protein
MLVPSLCGPLVLWLQSLQPSGGLYHPSVDPTPCSDFGTILGSTKSLAKKQARLYLVSLFHIFNLISSNSVSFPVRFHALYSNPHPSWIFYLFMRVHGSAFLELAHFPSQTMMHTELPPWESTVPAPSAKLDIGLGLWLILLWSLSSITAQCEPSLLSLMTRMLLWLIALSLLWLSSSIHSNEAFPGFPLPFTPYF